MKQNAVKENSDATMGCVFKRILCVMVKLIVWMAVMKVLHVVSKGLILQRQLGPSKQFVAATF